MSAVELDRQGIERRDFPIVRRGYDPVSVDAHLRALAADVEELLREASSRGGESLASSAGMQVQGILEAAQATAETIEREAAQDAQRVRESADADARRTREEAVARAQEHVAAVSQATAGLLEHVGSMDGETRALIDSLRAGASRLASDLAAVEANMGELYDAAAGRSGGGEPQVQTSAGYDSGGHAVAAEMQSERLAEMPSDVHAGMQGDPYVEAQAGPLTEALGEPHLGETGAAFEQELPLPQDGDGGSTQQVAEDLDGARLVALNMALNGDSREETGRYLDENFAVADRERLLNEVYAAIEG
jgi:DivIVA domain-containing protein